MIEKEYFTNFRVRKNCPAPGVAKGFSFLASDWPVAGFEGL